MSKSELLVMLDMDGVILKSPSTPRKIYKRATNRTLRKLGSDADASSFPSLVNFHLTHQMIDECDKLGVPVSLFWRVREKFAAQAAKNSLESDNRALFSDIDGLKKYADNTTFCIVSNNRLPTINDVIDCFNLDFISFAVGRSVGISGYFDRKPRPNLLLKAQKLVDLSKYVYVGDRQEDIIAAKASSSRSVFVRRLHNSNCTLSAEPDMIVDSVAKLISDL